MTVGDLFAQVRSGNRGETLSRQVEGLADHFIHALLGVPLDALHQADDDGGIGNQVLELGERHARELGGDGDDDDIGVLDGLRPVARGGHVVGQLGDGRQTNGIVVPVADALHDFGLDGPHRHVIARVCHHLTKSGAPCAGTQYSTFHNPLPYSSPGYETSMRTSRRYERARAAWRCAGRLGCPSCSGISR